MGITLMCLWEPKGNAGRGSKWNGLVEQSVVGSTGQNKMLEFYNFWNSNLACPYGLHVDFLAYTKHLFFPIYFLNPFLWIDLGVKIVSVSKAIFCSPSADFLILFFTEALFYCGVAVFVLLIDHLRRPIEPDSATGTNRTLVTHLGQRISSVAALVLSLIIPMVTMGLVWPWTGPAASATLAPYLVGIVVQFAFEQYARYKKSPSWSVIPIIFQVRAMPLISDQTCFGVSFSIENG